MRLAKNGVPLAQALAEALHALLRAADGRVEALTADPQPAAQVEVDAQLLGLPHGAALLLLTPQRAHVLVEQQDGDVGVRGVRCTRNLERLWKVAPVPHDGALHAVAAPTDKQRPFGLLRLLLLVPLPLHLVIFHSYERFLQI